MAFFIRPLAATEAGRLQTFQYLSLHVPEGHPPFDKTITDSPSIRKYFAHWGREGDIAFVAETADQQIVGAIWSRLHITEYPGYAFIDEDTPEFSLAVLPEHRKQGIGTKLLQRYLEEIKYQGFRKVSLSVDATNPASRLYERLGFRVVSKTGNPTMLLNL
ncbi:MAG: GNAT family N-acetyltransferase [Bacteroidota bacterium]